MNSSDGKLIKFHATLNGNVRGTNQVVVADDTGMGLITGQRLYQLTRKTQDVKDQTFDIKFLELNIQIFAFIFGLT